MRSSTAIALCAVVCVMYSTATAQRIDGLTASVPESHTALGATNDIRETPASRDPHVRIEDTRMRTLITHAAESSPTLQGLIDRLEHSDVVAYVRCDMSIGSSASGNLSFVGTTAGLRYVLIRLRYLGSKPAQAALVGHELRHAVEVADAASVIDVPSFDAEYARIGFISLQQTEHTIRSYETLNAIHAAEQIRRELRQNTE